MPRKKKKFIDKKNARTYHVVSGEHEGNILEAQPEMEEFEDYATVTTRGGGGGKYVSTRKVRYILGSDPVRDSYKNPVMDRSLRPYLKPIGEDLRGVYVANDGTVTPAKYLKGATALKNAPEFLNLKNNEEIEDMGDGVGLRPAGAAQAAAAAAARGESDDDFLPPDMSDLDSDEVEFRTDVIALPEDAADTEVAAILDEDFDSDALEEFGQLQDDFVQFAIAEEEKHPRLVEDEEHVKVAADFEEKRLQLMREAGIEDGEEADEEGDEADIPFGFGMQAEGGSEDEDEDRGRHRGMSASEGYGEEAHDFSDVVGAAERYRQRFVDEHFNVAVRREYDNEEEWGEMGEDDVEGGQLKPESALFTDMMDEFMDQPKENQKLFSRSKDVTQDELEKGKRVALQHGAVDLPEITEEEYFNKPKRSNWDCATIVSTYSNLENHPSVIDGDDMSGVIVLSAKTGLPIVDVKAKRKQQKKQKKALASLAEAGRDRIREEGEEDEEEGEEDEEEGEEDEYGSDEDSDGGETVMTSMSMASVSTRAKHETAAEKRERKAAVKQARREARANKKAVKEAYKKEGARLDKAKARNARNMGGRSQFSYSSKTTGVARR